MKNLGIIIFLSTVSLLTRIEITEGKGPAFGRADSTLRKSDYLLNVWQAKDGLPQNSVHAVCQTKDGYLWLGTEEGLVRFDGVKFTVFTPENTSELKSKFVSSLFESMDSTLWIGTNGGGVTSQKNLRFQHHVLQGVSNGRVISIAGSVDGGIWISLVAEGAIKLMNGNTLDYPSEQQGLGEPVRRVVQNNGMILFIGSMTALLEDERGSSSRFDLGSLGRPAVLSACYDDKTRVLWLGTVGKGLYAIRGESVKRYTTANGLPGDIIVSLYLDSYNTLWIGTAEGGLSAFVTRDFEQSSNSILFAEIQARSIAEDQEGNIWVGTRNDGLYRLTRSRFTVYGERDGLNNKHVTSMYADKHNRIWVGTMGGGVHVLENGTFLPANFNNKLQSKSITPILRDRHGALWVGTTNGLHRIDGRAMQIYTRRNGLSGDYINSLYEDSKGILWVGTAGGLSSIDAGKITIYRRGGGLSHNSVSSFLEDSDGGYWVGTFGGGLNHFKHGKWSTFTEQHGLSNNSILTLYRDKDGILWIGTLGGGLTSYRDGHFRKFKKSDGLFNDTIYQILEDERGNLWMGSNLGIFSVEKKQLAAFASGSVEQITSYSYGMEHGMLDLECNGGFQPSGLKLADGHLVFPTQAGVVLMDPSRITKASPRLPVILEDVFVNRTNVVPTPGLELPPGSREVEFRYTALHYLAPTKIRFKYMLEGFDREWIDAENRRAVYYTNLPAGAYQFRVIARSSDGDWNEQGASLSFHLHPYFYETRWFYLIVMLMLVLAGAGTQHVYHQFRQKELLASNLQSQVVRAQLQMLRSQLNPHFLFNTLNAISGLILTDPRNAVKMMARLSDFIRMTIYSELEQKVTLQAEIDSLQKYVEIEQLRLGDRLFVEYDIPPDLWSAYVPSLLLQPLVENAIRHGIVDLPEGGRIDLRCSTLGTMLNIEIRDSGKGLNGVHTDPSRTGVGLANSRSRLEQLYGKGHSFTVEKAQGGGTVVSISLPLEKGDQGE